MRYSLLPNNEQKTYERMFKLIKSELTRDPATLSVDYEKATINAAQKVFPNCRVEGCLFHFAQSMWKNFVKKIENCEVKWRNFNCRTVFRKIECLAFIPTSSVINGFKLIRDTASSYFHSFLDDYFEKYYIGSEVDVDVNGKNIKKRKVPSFPISLWSVYDRLIKNLPKTNNSIESWHK
jgi:hypothetical protein